MVKLSLNTMRKNSSNKNHFMGFQLFFSKAVMNTENRISPLKSDRRQLVLVVNLVLNPAKQLLSFYLFSYIYFCNNLCSFEIQLQS